MSTADLFGSDSSGNEFDPAEAAVEEEDEGDVQNEGENAGRTGSSGGGDADVLEDSDDGNNNAAAGGEPASAFEPATGGTGLSDSEDEEPQQQQPSAADAAKRVDADVFGTDSEDDIGAPSGGGGTEAGGGASAGAEDGFDPFEDSDDDGDQGGGSGSQEGKTLRGGGGGRLSKGGGSGKGKGKKRKAGADGSSSKKKTKSKSQDDGGDASTNKKKKKKKKKRKRKDGEDGGEGEGEGEGGGKKKKGKKKKGKKKEAETSVESSTLQDLGLESSADEAADEEDDDDMSDEEVEHEDEDEDEVASGDEVVVAGDTRGDVRTRDDDDFIDNSDDNADLLEEYKRDAPEEGGHSEAEEDNGPEDAAPKKESAMASVLASMKKRKAQELGTSEREQIAQEFMFKINQAAEDDEEAVQNQSPAIYKLKMLPTVKATLAKKELQETFLEFDLLGVLKRWLQPYSNKQLPNLTVRRSILEVIRGLPVQIDHLKRSGIGKTVMGLLNCRQETTENKRILRELVSKWNRPVYEKETNYRARRPAHDDLEAMEVRPKGASAVRRRVVSGSMSQRDGAGKDEAVGNILNAKAKGLDPTKARVPFSNGYAFSKAPRSRVEGNGRAPSQQVDTSARAKMLKKIAGLAKPVSKSA